MNVSLIRENIENIVNFPYVNLEVQEILMEEAINQQYIITSTSPLILKENYAIAQNSILIQATSFNHLPFNHYTIEEQEGLLELLNYTEYTIDDTTPSFIKLDPRIVLISIKHDLTSFQYTSVELLKNKEIFHYLIKNHYPFTKETLCYLPLYYLMDEEILDFYLKNYFKLDKNSNQFIMMKTLFNHLLHYPVKLKDFESIFRVFIEQSWTTLKIEQENRYKNVLGKLCSELSQNEDIEKILSSSFYVLDMKRKMKKNYALLDENLRKYHQYYHQQEEELLLQSRNIIAEFTKKYQAMIKENYIIEKLETYLSLVKPYFIINRNQTRITNKAKEKLQREVLREKYDAKETSVMHFIHYIIGKYQDKVDRDTLTLMVEEFIYNKNSSITPPKLYQEYLIYLKVQKLIHRLNQNYISFDSFEVEKYQKYISYHQNHYDYLGKIFTLEELSSLKNYQEKEWIYRQIRKELVNFSKTFMTDEEKLENHLFDISKNLSFDDQNYEFNTILFFNHFTVQDLLDVGFLTMIEENINLGYILNQILVNQGLLAFMMISKDIQSLEFTTLLEEYEITTDKLVDMVKHLKDIVFLARKMNVDITDFKSFCRWGKIIKAISSLDVYILGEEVLEKLCTKLEFTNQDTKAIVNQGVDLACRMRFKDRLTIPYIKGSYKGYTYQMYDAIDIELLTSGIDTNSCFKIEGHDHDFLHYCALNKNGFVIKFMMDDNLIARVAGFRNGNAIYFNQLRTIYDYDGLGYTNKNLLEKEALLSLMYHVSREIIKISQQNPLEKDKIDYCFITKSFIFSEEMRNVNKEVKAAISNYPMDYVSENWYHFIETTKNLKEAKRENRFTNDYDNYPLICLASSTNVMPKTKDDIKKKDVPALYTRTRGEIKVYHEINASLRKKLNQLKAIYAYLTKTSFDEVIFSHDAKIIMGDNWYIVYQNEILDFCILPGDKYALVEYQMTLEELKKCKRSKVYQKI